MDIGKRKPQATPGVDPKYLHAFAPSSVMQNGHRHVADGKFLV